MIDSKANRSRILHMIPCCPRVRNMTLQPHATAFVEPTTDLTAAVEMMMWRFSCLGLSERDFRLHAAMDVDGVKAIDMNLELPLDYVEPTREEEMMDRVDGEKVVKTVVFEPFVGTAWRLDGTAMTVESSGRSAGAVEERKIGGGKEEGKVFKPFTGRSRVLGGRILKFKFS